MKHEFHEMYSEIRFNFSSMLNIENTFVSKVSSSFSGYVQFIWRNLSVLSQRF